MNIPGEQMIVHIAGEKIIVQSLCPGTVRYVCTPSLWITPRSVVIFVCVSEF